MNHFDEGHSADLQAHELGTRLRDAALADATVEHLAAEAERLRRAVSQIGQNPRPQAGRLGKGAWLFAAAALLSVLLVGVWFRQRQQVMPLAFDVVGPGRVSASYVATPDDTSALLKFTDGSAVVAHQATRVRVPDLRLDGATLVLERGRATFEVVHRTPSTRWNVVAGPFTIAVTGTKFTVEWSPSAEKFSVDMLEGLIEVDGPRFTAPATLRGGQRMEANANDSAWAVTPLLREASAAKADPTNSPVVAAAAVQPPQPDRSVGGTTGRSVSAVVAPVAASAVVPATSPSTENKSWAKMVAQGESSRVISEAEAMGIRSCLGQCNGSDLRALADAARYSGRLDLAEASLRALRDKYPAHAAVAAYLLGAVDEARGRNASALRWYEEYVAAAPNGGFSSEALAGRLRMLVATNGYTSARKAAQQYLELHPTGVGVRTAKQILDRR